MTTTLRRLALASATSLLIFAALLWSASSASAHGPGGVAVDAPSSGSGVSASDVQVDQPTGTQTSSRGGACASCSVTDPTVSSFAPLTLTGLVLGAAMLRRRRR